MRGAGFELDLLGDECGQRAAHADEDFLSLRALGDLDRIPGHRVDQGLKHIRAFDLIQPEHVGFLII